MPSEWARKQNSHAGKRSAAWLFCVVMSGIDKYVCLWYLVPTSLLGGDILANKAYNFRLTPEVNDHLDFLCSVTGVSRTAFITGMIESEYDRYQGNPELQKVLGKMMELKSQMESMMLGNSDTLDSPRKSLSSPPVGACSDCVHPCKDEIAPDEIGVCDDFRAVK